MGVELMSNNMQKRTGLSKYIESQINLVLVYSMRLQQMGSKMSVSNKLFTQQNGKVANAKTPSYFAPGMLAWMR